MFNLHYIAKPYFVSQVWGVVNPIYKQFGFNKHNGEDISLGKDKLIYCPIEAKAYRILWQPSGGGNVLSILTDLYDWPDGKKAKVLIDFMHLEKVMVVQGQVIKIGDKMAIADNTGFSSGNHTHIQARRVVEINGELINVDINDANNSFDHSKHYTGKYASDLFTETPLSSGEIATIKIQKSFIEILKSYVNLLENYLKK